MKNTTELISPSRMRRGMAHRQGHLDLANALLQKETLRNVRLLEIQEATRDKAAAAEGRAREFQAGLFASEQFTQRLLESSADCIKLLDLEGRLLYFNPPGRRLLQIRNMAEFLNTPWINFWEAENRDAARLAVARARAGEQGHFQACAPTMRGVLKWWDVTVTPVLNHRGKPEQLLSISRDITESKEAEQRTKYQSTLLESLNEACLDGILIVSPEGKMIYHNQRFVQMWGFPATVLRSRSDRLALQWAATRMEQPRRFLREVHAAYRDPFLNKREEIQLKDGRIFDRYGTPVRSRDGVYYGWVWFFRDISEQRAADAALRSATAEVERHSRELEKRVRLRTADLHAANVQLGALTKRLVELQEAERRRIARELHDQVGQQLTALKLILSRQLGAGKHPPQLLEARQIVLDLMQQVRQICLDLRPQVLEDLGLLVALKWHFKTYRRQTGIRVRFRHRRLKEAQIRHDHKMTTFRLIQEALTNAARHAQTDQLLVELTRRRGLLRIEVKDRGVGCDLLQTLPRHSSGLKTMRERVAVAGGSLRVVSAPEKGFRVIAELPFPETEKQE